MCTPADVLENLNCWSFMKFSICCWKKIEFATILQRDPPRSSNQKNCCKKTLAHMTDRRKWEKKGPNKGRTQQTNIGRWRRRTTRRTPAWMISLTWLNIAICLLMCSVVKSAVSARTWFILAKNWFCKNKKHVLTTTSETLGNVSWEILPKTTTT